EDLWIAVCASDERQADWEGGKWLPHNLHPQESDGAGPARLGASGFPHLGGPRGAGVWGRASCEPDASAGAGGARPASARHGVHGGHLLDGAGLRNAVILDLTGTLTWRPGRMTLRLDVSQDAVQLVRTDRHRQEQATALGRPDDLGLANMTALAKRLAPYRLG